MTKVLSKQAKFNKAMASGKSLTTAQIAAMGFANVADPAYAARNLHGLNVQRTLRETRKGTVSVYAIEA